MTRGKLIVIEGSDGSGKQTQTQRLVERLRTQGKTVGTFSFPNYEGPYGAEVRAYLGGKFGDFSLFDQALATEGLPEHVMQALRIGRRGHTYFASSLYLMDRWHRLPDLQLALDTQNFVVSDRYDFSNWGHQAPKLSPGEGDELIAWLRRFERDVNGIPKPDFIFYLDLPPEHAQRAMVDRRTTARALAGRRATDIHEGNVHYLERVLQQYIRLADTEGWTLIDCLDDNHQRKTVDTVADEIWSHLQIN